VNDWVVESPSFEEQLMNNRIVYLNQKGINEVVELIKNKDKEIERLNTNWNELEKWIEKERDKWEKYNPDCFVYYQSILDRMEELKGVDKECKN